MSYQLDWNVSLECLTKEDLLKKQNESNNWILVDTIGTYDGNTYKIKGSTTIPYTEVVDRRKELLAYNDIIIYCTRKSCVASKKVASALKMLNVPNVKIYEGGLEEWMEFNYPVEEV